MHHTNLAEVQDLFVRNAADVSVKRVVGCESFLAGRLASEFRGSSPAEMRLWFDIALRFAESEGVASAADHILVIAEKLWIAHRSAPVG